MLRGKWILVSAGHKWHDGFYFFRLHSAWLLTEIDLDERVELPNVWFWKTTKKVNDKQQSNFLSSFSWPFSSAPQQLLCVGHQFLQCQLRTEGCCRISTMAVSEWVRSKIVLATTNRSFDSVVGCWQIHLAGIIVSRFKIFNLVGHNSIGQDGKTVSLQTCARLDCGAI